MRDACRVREIHGRTLPPKRDRRQQRLRTRLGYPWTWDSTYLSRAVKAVSGWGCVPRGRRRGRVPRGRGGSADARPNARPAPDCREGPEAQVPPHARTRHPRAGDGSSWRARVTDGGRTGATTAVTSRAAADRTLDWVRPQRRARTSETATGLGTLAMGNRTECIGVAVTPSEASRGRGRTRPCEPCAADASGRQYASRDAPGVTAASRRYDRPLPPARKPSPYPRAAGAPQGGAAGSALLPPLVGPGPGRASGRASAEPPRPRGTRPLPTIAPLARPRAPRRTGRVCSPPGRCRPG
jgi:hypothetical protein